MDLDLDSFRFGRRLPDGADCCGKPRGCTNTNSGCLYLRHPWKRAMVFNDPAAPCQKMCIDETSGKPVQMRCTLLNTHAGPCEMVSSGA